MLMSEDKHDIILEMKDITKRFSGVLALDEASLTLHRGEIHALVGENGAGKSTLMKILQGIYTADAGTILYKNERVNFRSPAEGLSAGISMIHQEICLIPSFDVAENIWMGRETMFKQFGLINLQARYHETKQLLQKLDIELEPKAEISTLSVAQMQLVELARAISYNVDVIIMDEPTSALSDKEVQHLFKIVRDLSKQGKAVVFISHKLEELFEICTKLTVMRDGKTIDSRSISQFNINEVVSLIAGRELKELFPKTAPTIKEKVFECENLSCGNLCKNVSFHVRRGEILGICGLMGSGRTEIMRAIFGVDKADSGTIRINGKSITLKSPMQAIKFGLGMITEDRLRLGIIPGLSVKFNLSIGYLNKIYNKLGFIDVNKELKDSNDIVNKLGIKIAGLNQEINMLSGGNQQKAIIGRWLLTDPQILILDEPTRGIDVGAKVEVYRLIDDLAHAGLAIILVSSELPEILGMSDRILVVRNGEIAAEIPRAGATQEKLMNYAFGINMQEKQIEGAQV